jgi:hypothetical protein
MDIYLPLDISIGERNEDLSGQNRRSAASGGRSEAVLVSKHRAVRALQAKQRDNVCEGQYYVARHLSAALCLNNYGSTAHCAVGIVAHHVSVVRHRYFKDSSLWNVMNFQPSDGVIRRATEQLLHRLTQLRLRATGYRERGGMGNRRTA